MSSLSSILAPITSHLIEHENIPAAKRRKSNSPHLLSPGTGAARLLGKEERKKKWLAGLSHDELLGVANGAVWQGREVGGLHNRTCHSCKKVGALLECHNCPRSYHRRCLNPPIHGNFKIDGDWYCPNCEVLGLDLRERSVTVKVEDGVTPLHRIDITDERRNSGSEEKKGKKSKYTILPENVDEALGLLNRELQVAYQMKGVIAEMAAKLEVVEQQLRIQKGRADLLTLERMAGGAENERKLKTENTRLRKELEILKEEARRKEVELAEWKSSVKAIVDGK